MPFFGGESGEVGSSNAASDAILCCIICSNFSINMSFVSLACKMYRSSVESRGSSDRSIALTASYNMARVSGYGDLKYSSSANKSKGFGALVLIRCGPCGRITLYIWRNGCLVQIAIALTTAPLASPASANTLVAGHTRKWHLLTVLSCFVLTKFSTYISGGPSPPSSSSSSS